VEGFQVNTDSLRTSATGLDDVVDRFADTLEQFEATINGFGQPWGGDDVGSIIGELYLGIHDLAMTCFESNGELLGEFAHGLHTMADNFEATETEVTDSLMRLQNLLGGG
jgi:phage-related minor tail protein